MPPKERRTLARPIIGATALADIPDNEERAALGAGIVAVDIAAEGDGAGNDRFQTFGGESLKNMDFDRKQQARQRCDLAARTAAAMAILFAPI